MVVKRHSNLLRSKIVFGKIGQNKVGKLVMWPRLCTHADEVALELFLVLAYVLSLDFLVSMCFFSW